MANLANSEDFPGDQVAKTSPCVEGVQVLSLVGKLRVHVPHAPKTKTLKKKQKQYYNKFNTDFKRLTFLKKWQIVVWKHFHASLDKSVQVP